MVTLSNTNITRLIHALQLHLSTHGSYHPVDTEVMSKAIDTVLSTAINRDNSVQARLIRVLQSTDELEQPVSDLMALARPLALTDGDIEMALMYLDGHLIS